MTENRRDTAQEARNEKRLRFLVQAGEIFHQSLDVPRTLFNVAHLAVEWFADLCLFDLLDETSARLYVTSVAHRNPEKETSLGNLAETFYIEEYGTHPVLTVTRTGVPFFVPRMSEATYADHAASREHLRYMRELGYRSKIVVPVTAQATIFGALTFVSTTEGKYFDESDLTFAVELGRRAGLAIANAKQYEARKRIEERLQDSERRFRILAEAIPVICWTADAKGSIDWYNARWYEYTGQRADDALGWGWQTIFHPDDLLEVMRRWPRCLASGEAFEMEFRLRRQDGEYLWFLGRAEPLRGADDTIVRWYGSIVDVDARKMEHERMKRVAETLQNVFLPKQLPQRPGLRLDAHYIPAEQDALVGGDWFDALELPDGRLLFSIGDVGGHGLDASVAVGRLRQAILAFAFEVTDPGDILRRVDRILTHQDPDLLVTAIVGFIDSTLQSITYANAGHPPPVVAQRSDEPARLLRYGEPPLGCGYQGRYENVTIRIEPETVIALYTDGLTEFARDPLAGEQRLRSTLALFVGNSLPQPARAATQIIFNGATPRDDVAMMMLQFPSARSVRTFPKLQPAPGTWRFHSSDPHSANLSRSSIMSYLRQFACDGDLFSAELAIGEAIANTVDHAPGLVEVQVDWSEEHPVVVIRDDGPGLLELRAQLPKDCTDETGRGLFLMREFVTDASAHRLPDRGTELRLVLPLTRRQDAEA
ncbi:MAG TPA: SpoIIE family protein phosphatase [Candidatus Acidoferrales bacterium]|jgi:PAS domain S-box-containing protein|nr:SpoIIE family protein phosphatase [Candidatus Acidoferrales bacterium]